MRKPIWLLIVISLFFANFAAVQVAAQESDAPFIFYYGAGEIVIERADGTDRRVLGEGMDLWTLNDLTWSSTGRWIAWDNIDHDVYGDIAVDSIIISAVRYDNEQQFTFEIQEIYRDIYWQWSPTEDWLLITQSSRYDGLDVEIRVIDVETSAILLELDGLDYFPNWSADGRALERTRRQNHETTSDDPAPIETTYMRDTISMDGGIETSIITMGDYYGLESYLHWDAAQNSYVVDGSAYDPPIRITAPPDLSIQSLFWNESRNLALVYAIQRRPNSETVYEQNFYLLSLPDRQITFLTTFRVSPFHGEINDATTSIYNLKWSPTDDTILIYAIDGTPTTIDRRAINLRQDGSTLGLYLLSLSTGAIELISHHPMLPTYFGEHGGSTSQWTPWTPDGDKFLFATQERELAWFEVRSKYITALDLPVFSDMYLLRTVSPTYGLNWSDDGQHAVLTWRHNSWLYNATTDTISDEPISQHSLAYISPDGRYAVSLVACYAQSSHYHGPTSGRCIIDVDTGARTDLAVSGIFDYGGGGRAKWHLTEPWVILIEDRSERYSVQYYSITDTSGAFYRDLTESFEGRSSVDWLPENVPIDE